MKSILILILNIVAQSTKLKLFGPTTDKPNIGMNYNAIVDLNMISATTLKINMSFIAMKTTDILKI